MGIDGEHRILDIVPSALHDRTPLILGSTLDVEAFRDFAIGKR
jgi:fructose-1,6-bisphosphatase